MDAGSCGRATRLKSTFNLRLTSKKFAAVGARNIVESVHLCFRKKSFQNLENISKHEELRKHVKRITYDIDRLGYMSRKSWERSLPIPKYIPLPPGVRCLYYNQEVDGDGGDGITYMPGKHWEQCWENFPGHRALPADLPVPPFSLTPNFESAKLDPIHPNFFPEIDEYNRTRKEWMKKLLPRLVYSQLELDRGYERYRREIIETMAFLVNTNHDYTILTGAMKMFSQLQEVNILSRAISHREEDSHRQEDLKAAFKHTLTFPRDHMTGRLSCRMQDYKVGYGFRQAESIFHGLESSGIQLKTLTCGLLLSPFFQTNQSPQEQSGFARMSPELRLPSFRNLKRLEIWLKEPLWRDSRDGKGSALVKAIASAGSLSSLTLGVDWQHHRRGDHGHDLRPIMFDNIVESTTWKCLTTLSLSGLGLTEQFWLDFLQRHSRTLVSLTLDELVLTKGTWVDTFEKMKGIVAEPNILQDAKFSHALYQNENEFGQRVPECGYDMAFFDFGDFDYELGWKLADYLLNDEDNPFQAFSDLSEKAIRPYAELDVERYLVEEQEKEETGSEYSYDEQDNGSEAEDDEFPVQEQFREEVAIEARRLATSDE